MQVIWPRGPGAPDKQIKNRVTSALQRMKSKPDVASKVAAHLANYVSDLHPDTVALDDHIIWAKGETKCMVQYVLSVYTILADMIIL
jgi:hypothetical protein